MSGSHTSARSVTGCPAAAGPALIDATGGMFSAPGCTSQVRTVKLPAASVALTPIVIGSGLVNVQT